ncbi:MAG TPA: DUF4214 domain-containing protein [Pyrinomonadaceae bacterium]|nr:DUF4214 domain-containing protein [Pyrinomonadaceae bacterium]
MKTLQFAARSKQNELFQHYFLSVVLVITAIAVPVMRANAFDGSSGGATVVTKIEAEFAGAPINGVVPKGEAEFVVFSDGNRKFEGKVSNVNLADGTVLNVFVDELKVGTLRLLASIGELKLETRDGQTVPQINSRTRVVFTDTAGLTIVAGSFSNIPSPGPTPSPGVSPSPTPTPNPTGETRLESRLAGAPIGGLSPKGHAKFEVRSIGRKKLNVEVERVNLTAGTILNVLVDNIKVGEITLNAMLETELELDTERGSIVPSVTTLSSVVITNANGATILSGIFNTASSIIPGNDIDDTNYFVEQHYRDFLNREADDAGLDFWKGQISGCADDSDCRERARINTSGAFFLSTEFQDTSFLLYRFSKASFNAMPRRNDFLLEAQLISRGVVVNQVGWQQVLENNKREAAERWIKRDDFQAQFGSLSNRDFVNRIFDNVGVRGNEVEREDLIHHLDIGLETRGTVLRKAAENEDFSHREKNSAFVLMQYFGYLHRNPDEGPDHDLSGFNFWLNKLNEHHGDFHEAEMVKAFLRSVEYRDRFAW